MLCRPFHGLDGPPTLTWGSAFSSTPVFMLSPAPRAKTCHMPLDKTPNNLVSGVMNTALTKYSGALIHRRGRRGTQRESGILSPLRTSATSAVEPKIDNLVNAVMKHGPIKKPLQSTL